MWLCPSSEAGSVLPLGEEDLASATGRVEGEGGEEEGGGEEDEDVEVGGGQEEERGEKEGKVLQGFSGAEDQTEF